MLKNGQSKTFARSMKKARTYARRVLRRRYPLRFLAARLLWQSSLVRVIPITINRPAYKLRFFPSKLSADYWSEPFQTLPEEVLLGAYVRAGDVVVDVGANIGAQTLLASSLAGNRGRVIAIEPHPKTFQYLCENIALNRFQNIEPINVAVDEAEGTVVFSNQLLDTSNHVVSTHGLPVPARTLDNILSSYAFDHLDFLKLDIEGYEIKALRGAQATLSLTRCVYFEHIPVHFRRYGVSESDIFGVLYKAGFQVYRIAGDETNRVAVRDLDAFLQRTNGRLKLHMIDGDHRTSIVE